MIKETAKKLNFPAEAIDYFSDCYNRIYGNEAVLKDMLRAERLFFGVDPQDKTYLDIIQKVSDETGVLRDSVGMLFFLVCMEPLREKYREAGLSEALFWETMQDLRYKLVECKNVYGHWGTFVPSWFRRFYLCERFSLGRLQFERMEFPAEDYKGIIKRGDTVYCCHIPSSGALLETEVLASLKRGYEFFKGELKNGIMPVVCQSWLLYEPFKTTFAECGNILKFRALFDVVENQEEPTNGDFWRVFNTPYSDEALRTVPAETRLQKKLKEYLLHGNCMGFALGILLFNGEKIIKV